MILKWHTEWQVFLLAIQFLTRLPVPKNLPYSDDLLIRATRYYPLVGCVVGSIGAIVLVLASLALPTSVSVLLSIATTIAVTGAFHEDGLADSADGLGGGLTRDRALEIMRDSRIGTYGAVTLGMVLALKASVLMSFGIGEAAIILVIAHVASRMAAVFVVSKDSYAREVGAKFVAPSVTTDGYWFALGTTILGLLVGVICFGATAIVLAVLFAVIAGAVFRAIFMRKLEGYTGDCLGGVQQLSELGFYLGFALWL